MWGGRFNPIVMADRPDDAKRLVELFRADLIIPVGSTPEVVSFPELFPHLITPYIPDQLFLRHSTESTRAHPRHPQRTCALANNRRVEVN
jgi:hypothetical protein